MAAVRVSFTAGPAKVADSARTGRPPSGAQSFIRPSSSSLNPLSHPSGHVTRAAIRECNGSTGACSGAAIDIERSYDRDGNVASETQTMASGADPSQYGVGSFAYDGAGRVVSSSLNSVARAYTYDPDGNRTSVSVAGVTIDSFAFDTSDETISDTHAGTKTAFTYDRYGNLLSSGTAAAATTAYAYDLADRLDSITQADGSTVGFTFDAAGRHATRISGASTIDTYAYLGTSDSVLQDVSSTAGTINAAIDSAGRSPLQRR